MLTTAAVETTPKYRDLLGWARSHGAIIPSTLLFPSEPYGHCRTSVPIPKGTQLFHIPHKIIITPAIATAALPQLKDWPVHERVCAFLATERRKDGFWKEYLRSLPRKFRTPAYFEVDALEVFKGTNLAFAWRDKVAVWEAEYEHAVKVLPELEWYVSRSVWSLIGGQEGLFVGCHRSIITVFSVTIAQSACQCT